MIRRIGFSTRLAVFGAAMALVAFGCTTTSDEAETADTGSEFQQADQEEVEVAVEEVQETTVAVQEIVLDLQNVYFDFDKSNIRSDARPVLRANGDQMRQATQSVRIEGHTDERGSEEYNLELSQQRVSQIARGTR